jgi:hypothetical protein
MTQQHFVEKQFVRNITDSNFSRGQQSVVWDIRSNESFIPSESYLKIKYTLTKGDKSELNYSDGVGPNIYLGDSLFQQQEVFINNKSVSRINDYVHQIGAIKNRVYESNDKNNTYGNSLFYPQAELNERVNLVSANRGGYKRIPMLRYTAGGNVNQIPTIAFATAGDPAIYTITLADGAGGLGLEDVRYFLKIGDEILVRNKPIGGDLKTIYTTVLTIPTATTFTVADELLNENPIRIDDSNDRLLIRNKNHVKRRFNKNTFIYKPPLGFFDLSNKLGEGHYEMKLTPNTQSEFERLAIESFVTKTIGSTVNDIKFAINEMVLYLSCYSVQGARECVVKDFICQSQTINTYNLTQKEFEITEPSPILILAFQDNAAGNDSSLSCGKFKIKNDDQNNLSTMYIRYNNLQLPDPQSNPLKTLTEDEMADRYYENLIYANKNILKDSVEPIDVWFEKGIYFLFKYHNPTKTNVIVNVKFSKPFTNNTTSIACLLFSCSTKTTKF